MLLCSHLVCYIWSTSGTCFLFKQTFLWKGLQMTWMRQFDCVLTLQWASISDSWTHETSSKAVAMDCLFVGEGKMPAALLVANNLAGTTHIISACCCIITTSTSGSKFIVITLPQSSSAKWLVVIWILNVIWTPCRSANKICPYFLGIDVKHFNQNKAVLSALWPMMPPHHQNSQHNFCSLSFLSQVTGVFFTEVYCIVLCEVTVWL